MIALILLASVCEVQSILEGRFDHATADALQPAAAVDVGEARAPVRRRRAPVRRRRAPAKEPAGQQGGPRPETLSLNTVHYLAQRFKDLENATGVQSVRMVMLGNYRTLLFVPSLGVWQQNSTLLSRLDKQHKRFNLRYVVSAIFFQVNFENGTSALLSASRDLYLDTRGLHHTINEAIGSMANFSRFTMIGKTFSYLRVIAATTCADFNCERLGKAPLPVEQQARTLCYSCTDDLCCRDCSSYATLCYDKGKIPKPVFPDCVAAGCNLEEECCQDRATCYSFKHRCEAVGLIMPDEWKKKECHASECQEMGECCVRPNISAS